MRLDRNYRRACGVRGPAVGTLAGLAVLGVVFVGGVGHADPAQDALATLRELSREAERTTEAMHSARLDLDAKRGAQDAAEARLAADRATLQQARSSLATYQAAVDEFAAAQYMGGRLDGPAAMLTAGSPQQLIDHLAVQRVMAGEMTEQMQLFVEVGADAARAEVNSTRSATDARTAAEQAAAVQADLQAKQGQLQAQIVVVRSQYEMLTPAQRAVLADPGPVPPLPVPAPQAPGPVPDAILAAPEAPAPDAVLPGIPPGDLAAPAPAVGDRTVVVQAALTRVGMPYAWGGSGPSAFDCSGLIAWSFRQMGISLPHSSQALASGGQPVARGQLLPGDVVNYYSDASHSGIYVGNGMVVHSSTYGQPVKVVPVDGAGPFLNARRY